MLMLILVFALLLLIAGLILLIKPDYIPGFIDNYADSWGLYISAILARLGLGCLLIYLAGLSRFPMTITVIGWIAILAAVVFLLMGKQKFTAMLRWIMNKIKPWVRAGGVASLLFGAFLLYSFA